MSSIDKNMHRVWNWVGGSGFTTGGEQTQKKHQKRQVRLDKVYASAVLPDDEMVRRNERRKQAGRRGSRQRNVLTEDQDMLGGQ